MHIPKDVTIFIRNVRDFLTCKKLTIPNYQRPYKWQAKHVNQLIDDILCHKNAGKKTYRIGTVVLHRHGETAQEEQLDIVDGQQRLITLTLLVNALDKQQHSIEITPLRLLDCEFSSPITHANAHLNAKLIVDKLQHVANNSDKIKEYVLDHCELVCTVLEDLGEAFQFFDSQNSRGKPLAPYDLLKAFHLREIPSEESLQTQQYVQAWENSVSPTQDNEPSLETIMRDILYPLRRWTYNKEGMIFNQSSIATFKGLNPQQNPDWPIARMLHMLDTTVPFNPSSDHRLPVFFPFQVSYPIINGRRFFEYIQHYRRMYRQLFIEENSSINSIITNINKYDGHKRTGDRYIRDLFYATVLFYFDKFGHQHLDTVVIKIFQWCYFLRFEKARVSAPMINNYVQEENSLLKIIECSISPEDTCLFIPPSIAENQAGYELSKDLLKTFEEYFVIRRLS